MTRITIQAPHNHSLTSARLAHYLPYKVSWLRACLLAMQGPAYTLLSIRFQAPFAR